MTQTDRMALIFFGGFFGLFVLAWILSLIFLWIEKYREKRFRRLHPDWVEANDAFCASIEQGSQLEKQQKKLRKAIDDLNDQCRYLPSDCCSKLEHEVALLKVEYRDLCILVKQNTQRTEELRKRYLSLNEAYGRQ